MMSLPVWLPGPMFLLGRSLSGGLCPVGSLFRGSLSRGSLSGGSLSRGVSVRRETTRTETPGTVKKIVRNLLECILIKFLFALKVVLKLVIFQCESHI